MRGLEILARSLSIATTGSPGGKPFQYGNAWQYHPRSDRHSKIACWAIMFDLLSTSPLLRQHAGDGKIRFGINHEMTDFSRNRKKNLDMVICRGLSGQSIAGVGTFAKLRDAYKIDLTPNDLACLTKLPDIPLAKPSTVLVALEAKACMTEFGKARPRLYDELNSSHLTIHGDSARAIAAGFAIVNIADTFISPLRNHWPMGTHPTALSRHKQPRDAQSVVDKLMQLPRRSGPNDEGFDAFAIAVVQCVNDGSVVSLHKGSPAPQSGDIYNYAGFVDRLAHLYATQFSSI